MGVNARERDTDAGAADKADAERTCALTREPLTPEDGLRFVAGPDGTIVPDVGRRLPGRGVWLTGNRAVVVEAARKGAFQRSLKRPVVVPDGLADLVEQLLVKRVIEALSLANKAGLADDRVHQGRNRRSTGRLRLPAACQRCGRRRGREARPKVGVRPDGCGPGKTGKWREIAHRQLPVVNRIELGHRAIKCGTCCTGTWRCSHQVFTRGRAVAALSCAGFRSSAQ